VAERIEATGPLSTEQWTCHATAADGRFVFGGDGFPLTRAAEAPAGPPALNFGPFIIETRNSAAGDRIRGRFRPFLPRH